MTARRLPPLNALRAFEAAARHGSFARAAQELHVTPAAISQQIRQLEDHLQMTLFDRLPRGLALTQVGRDYLPEVTRGFDTLAKATERLRVGELGGELTVSTTFTMGMGWLIPRLPKFRARYPDIDLHVRTDDRIATFDDGVDMALRYGRGIYPGLRVDLLMKEELYPICSPVLLDGPNALRRTRDLRHHTLIHDEADGGEPWLGWTPWLQDFGLHDLLPARGTRFTSSLLSVHAVLDGQGVGIGRSVLVGEQLRDGRLIRPFDIARPGNYTHYVVCPEATADRPEIVAFRNWVLEEAAAMASWLPASQTAALSRSA